MRVVLLAAVAIGLAAFTTAPPPATGVRTHPDWARKPDPDSVSDHYPDRARRLEVAGATTIDCHVRVDGRLDDCRILSETPEGYGFGAAAAKMAVEEFLMKPATLDGEPVDGGRVRIPVAFSLPPPSESLKIEGLDKVEKALRDPWIIAALAAGGLLPLIGLVLVLLGQGRRRPTDV